jgi:RHS repeat-associated protein
MNAPTFFHKPLDSIGRRVSKQVWKRTGGSWTDEGRTAFVYEGWNLISEISNLPSQIESSKNYVWGLDLSGSLQGAGGINGLLAHTYTDSSGSSQVFHYTYDLNGNVSEVLDGSGLIAAHYEYGPFGEMLREAYQSLEVRRSLGEGGFNFSTKYHDRETGLLYYGYRYYDPTAGRWLNRDPIEESGGVNLYGFVGNNPISRWDKLGLDSDEGGLGGRPNYNLPWGTEKPDPAVVAQAATICEGYPQGTKCCGKGGTYDVDPYPAKARTICKRFFTMYGAQSVISLNTVKCVAACLVAKEKAAQSSKSCCDRNKQRINAHAKCYISCGFVPGRGLPAGGWGVGAYDLLPDWARSYTTGCP